jgi:ADP-ribosyl-[dinitrogen reductase] hydrolase
MIAGAFYGLDAIPRRWVKKLNPRVREEIEELSERLVRLSPWFSKQGRSHSM